MEDLSLTTVGAACTAAGAMLGGGITAFVAMRKATSDIKINENNQTLLVQNSLITHLTERVAVLEEAEKNTNNAHMDCERRCGILEGRIEQMERYFNAETIRCNAEKRVMPHGHRTD